ILSRRNCAGGRAMVPAPHPSGLLIRRVSVVGTTVTVAAEGAGNGARCPACGSRSTTVHARYQRRPLDLPWRGATVRLQVTVRRFRCGNGVCARTTFAEDFGAVLPRQSQRTTAATDLLLQFV